MQYGYSAASDLRTLSDERQKVTSWGYNSFGRVTSKTNDANVEILRYQNNPNGWLINRRVHTYDNNGNLTNDTARVYSYDDENQLIGITVANYWKSGFVYEGFGRRRTRTEATWNGSSWVTNTIMRYLYDGMTVSPGNGVRH